MYHLLVQIGLSFIGTVAFGLFIQVPVKALGWAGFAGSLGWTCYWLLVQINVGKIAANFLGALVVGLSGLILARVKKQPSTIFNIPGLVPLVPGASAYQALEQFMAGQRDSALTQVLHVTLLTGAIALGYVLAQLIGEVWFQHTAAKARHTK